MTNAVLLAAMKLDMERRGLLPRSIDKRGIMLLAFMRWLGDRSILNVDKETIEQFLDARGIGPRTRRSWLANFRGFYKFATAEGLCEEDPTEKIQWPKPPRALPRPAATHDLAQLLIVGTPIERCWVGLAALQGLRCQEIAGMRREDVIETEGLLRVCKGKGGHERMLPLHPDVLLALRALPMPRKGWIFTRVRGGPYSANWLSACFNRFLHANQVDATAHQLRHWFASQLYSSTHDIRLTQEMLGHSDPGTTAIYAAFDRRAAAVAIKDLSFADSEPPEEAA